MPSETTFIFSFHKSKIDTGCRLTKTVNNCQNAARSVGKPVHKLKENHQNIYFLKWQFEMKRNTNPVKRFDIHTESRRIHA
jgi:hypothetical protein